jgi:hypothetical protein
VLHTRTLGKEQGYTCVHSHGLGTAAFFLSPLPSLPLTFLPCYLPLSSNFHSIIHSLNKVSASFLAVLGFKLRALNLLGRCSTTWRPVLLPPSPFCFSHFSNRVLWFCPRQTWASILLLLPPEYLG